MILSAQTSSVQRPGKAPPPRSGLGRHLIGPGIPSGLRPMFPSPKLPNFCTKSPRPGPEDLGPACPRCPPLLTLRVGLSVAPIFPLGRVLRSTASCSPPRAPGAVISYGPGPARSRVSHLQPRPTRKPRDRLGGKASPPLFQALAPLGHDGRRHFQANAGAGGVAFYRKNAGE